MLNRLLLPIALCCLGVIFAGCGGDEFPPQFPVSLYLGVNIEPSGVGSQIQLNPGDVLPAHAFAIQRGGNREEVTSLVQWRSSAPNVASVNNVGVIVANSPGVATITANLLSSEGQIIPSQAVNVFVSGTPVDGPGPAPTLVGVLIRNADGTPVTGTITLDVDDTYQLQAVGRYSNGSIAGVSGVTWRVSDQTIAQVSATGQILPLGPTGIITVNARVGTLESNYVVVQVVDNP
ncbi:MAG TPA: Ig-like domain-containing protein [bacterium]|nr:Ig-like domain-containing protein [bacterium]